MDLYCYEVMPGSSRRSLPPYQQSPLSLLSLSCIELMNSRIGYSEVLIEPMCAVSQKLNNLKFRVVINNQYLKYITITEFLKEERVTTYGTYVKRIHVPKIKETIYGTRRILKARRYSGTYSVSQR
jgi:hypothetical protein